MERRMNIGRKRDRRESESLELLRTGRSTINLSLTYSQRFNFQISQFGGTVWEWNDVRQQYYLHQFAIEQADFNFRLPAVRQEMLNILNFWFERGVDGFRLDALPHLFEADPANHGGVYPDEPLSGNMFLNENQTGYTTQLYVRDLIELYDVVYEWRDFSDRWQRENGGDTK